MITKLPVVRSTRGTQHAVWADGHSTAGSLLGCYTLCGLRVGSVGQWPEQTKRFVTCGNCKRIIEALRRDHRLCA